MTQTVDSARQQPGVGKATRRQDGSDKITGRTRYAGDLPFPGLLHARLVLSPYAHARILNIDTAAALALPGVVAVFTSKNLGMANANSPSRSQAPLAQNEVYWCGHPVAVVIGETEAAAEDGVAAVDVDYEPLPVVVDPLAALLPSSPPARSRSEEEVSTIAGGGAHAAVSEGDSDEEEDKEELSQNVSDKVHIRSGDIEAGLREADVVIERTYTTSFVHQSYLEPQSITVVPSPSGHQLTAWPSTQAMLGARSDISRALNLAERQVRVESVPIGGAFGGKFGLSEPLGAAVAYKLRKPVRLVYTRQEDLLAGNPAPQSVITLKLGAKRDGTLVAMQGKMIFDSGAYPGASAGLGGHILTSTYRCPNIDLRCYEVLTNKVSVGAYRAPNAPQSTFALESAVGELCQALQMDSIEFRKKNALKEGDATLNPHSPQWPRIGIIDCLEEIEKHPLWAERGAQKAVPAELEGWKIGVGVAVGGWPGGTEPAAAACRLESDGSITLVVGSVDLTGSDTSLALIASDVLGVSSDTVEVAHGNTDTMPYSGGTGGSKTIYTMGAAVLSAARDAREQILKVASDMLEASVDDLEIEDGNVAVRGVPGKSVTLRQIAEASMRFAGQFEPIYGRGRSANSTTSPMYAAHIAKVAVDPATGEVRVLDYVAAQDVGRAINPAEVEGQIYGGVTQGIGWALLEGFVYDEEGQMLTSTFMDYAVPHSEDVPNITPILVEIPAPLGPYGAKGVGEPPVVPVGAAIANAIDDAVGARVTQLPIRPERLFNALNGKQ
ncbi:xanthine dehydrogenase family protein molybdopterin-binding subunit [Ktedonosporobacter rubrisoli]|uniref:Xanthine dehydrogenase family protein molybdopterin-binding subunit n=1 Tax=Ktedonosporobacter rubrisoli TaxID=2509675 RepID=A0A4P6K2Y0_KTERU|nr:xanthine dehydrogenase family protein molybdopterin-binding subunit [Ktedonosporobacter rubrisoli]QBD82282.1 xanthine dehydrogenase family protein molybdopterin-binding subunit [Ktedonosporobacter rubrisoli]